MQKSDNVAEQSIGSKKWKKITQKNNVKCDVVVYISDDCFLERFHCKEQRKILLLTIRKSNSIRRKKHYVNKDEYSS